MDGFGPGYTSVAEINFAPGTAATASLDANPETGMGGNIFPAALWTVEQRDCYMCYG